MQESINNTVTKQGEDQWTNAVRICLRPIRGCDSPKGRFHEQRAEALNGGQASGNVRQQYSV
jgi:hypothetical protein